MLALWVALRLEDKVLRPWDTWPGVEEKLKADGLTMTLDLRQNPSSAAVSSQLVCNPNPLAKLGSSSWDWLGAPPSEAVP